jgi:hypothetical protein
MLDRRPSDEPIMAIEQDAPEDEVTAELEIA